jgi:hypothetical protein
MNRLDLALSPQLFRNPWGGHTQRQQRQKHEDNDTYEQEALLSLANLIVLDR